MKIWETVNIKCQLFNCIQAKQALNVVRKVIYLGHIIRNDLCDVTMCSVSAAGCVLKKICWQMLISYVHKIYQSRPFQSLLQHISCAVMIIQNCTRGSRKFETTDTPPFMLCLCTNVC